MGGLILFVGTVCTFFGIVLGAYQGLMWLQDAAWSHISLANALHLEPYHAQYAGWSQLVNFMENTPLAFLLIGVGLVLSFVGGAGK